jgi:hypothetical protein
MSDAEALPLSNDLGGRAAPPPKLSAGLRHDIVGRGINDQDETPRPDGGECFQVVRQQSPVSDREEHFAV